MVSVPPNGPVNLEEEGIDLEELYCWCNQCQFVSAVHPRASKTRYNAEMHCLGEKHKEKRKAQRG